MKKIPMRRCIATMTQAPKKELIRIVRTPEGEVKIDLSGKANGRGAYLLKTNEAIELAQKKGALRRALECDVPDTLFEELREVIGGKKQA